MRLPAGYRGVVLQGTDAVLPPAEAAADANGGGGGEGEDEDGDGEREREMEMESEPEPDVKVLHELAEFAEVVVWGHEMLVEGVSGGDPYVRGLEEWIGVAGVVNCED